MPNLRLADLTAEIEANVRRALLEDIGSGDITAQLIPAERLAKATIITRDAAVIAGTAWVDAVFRQLDPRVAVHWQVRDGERVKPNQALFHLEGPARSLPQFSTTLAAPHVKAMTSNARRIIFHNLYPTP